MPHRSWGTERGMGLGNTGLARNYRKHVRESHILRGLPTMAQESRQKISRWAEKGSPNERVKKGCEQTANKRGAERGNPAFGNFGPLPACESMDTWQAGLPPVQREYVGSGPRRPLLGLAPLPSRGAPDRSWPTPAGQGHSFLILVSLDSFGSKKERRLRSFYNS